MFFVNTQGSALYKICIYNDAYKISRYTGCLIPSPLHSLHTVHLILYTASVGTRNFHSKSLFRTVHNDFSEKTLFMTFVEPYICSLDTTHQYTKRLILCTRNCLDLRLRDKSSQIQISYHINCKIQENCKHTLPSQQKSSFWIQEDHTTSEIPFWTHIHHVRIRLYIIIFLNSHSDNPTNILGAGIPN